MEQRLPASRSIRDLPNDLSKPVFSRTYPGFSVMRIPRILEKTSVLTFACMAWLAGCAGPGNRADSSAPPSPDRFTKVVLDQGLYEPMELDMLDDGRILFIQRRGAVKIHDPATAHTETVAEIDVFTGFEEGLIGVALDPDYAANRWVYFAYSAPDTAVIRLARFVLDDDVLDRESERILLEIPVQREECCHVGGSLEFGPEGHLFLSVGDNTNPFASSGFAPIDERAGRKAWDAQGSAANTMDLRGKILRILPKDDGTYAIPEDNLFADGAMEGRPEIYVMGNRNPFRIAIDDRTGYLYWGEVGPDAGESLSERGPMGHDEVNQAREAGNFGWPHFVGDNKAYHDYDFEAEAAGSPFDPAAPVNDSPNNTGSERLPPAQPAFIWYPYGPSDAFPLIGEGGRNAMAGPVYYYDDYPESDRKFPRYYDGKLFIYDWMRNWIRVVTMDEEGQYAAMEEFMPTTGFSKPVDMLFGPDGALYMLEYGETWYGHNPDARLFRIDYAVRNRAPIAHIAADHSVGAAPLTVTLSAADSFDPDGDAVAYAWRREGDAEQISGEEAVYSFTEPGTYAVTLAVTDGEGLTGEETLDILVGNAIPDVRIEFAGNRTFFWDDRAIEYAVVVTDPEDGDVADEEVAFTVDYLARGADLTVQAQGHQAALARAAGLIGQSLIEQYNCGACHLQTEESIGPAFAAVAGKYPRNEASRTYLSEKIVQGGAGVWGARAMAPHPHVSVEEAARMAEFILGLGDDAARAAGLPLQGAYVTDRHEADEDEGRYFLTASYTDRGAADMPRLTGRSVVVLRHPTLQAERFDEGDRTEAVPAPEPVYGEDATGDVVFGDDGGYFVFRDIDLTDVRSLAARIGTAAETTTGGRLEVRTGAVDGEVLGTFATTIPHENSLETYEIALDGAGGKTDLYFVFAADEPGGASPVLFVDWIRAQW